MATRAGIAQSLHDKVIDQREAAWRNDGRVDKLKILRSSGYNSFDRAGLQAVQNAKMPPLPKSYRSPSLGVRLIIR